MRVTQIRSPHARSATVLGRLVIVAAFTVVLTGVVGVPDRGTPAHLSATEHTLAASAYRLGQVAHVDLQNRSEMVGFTWHGSPDATFQYRALTGTTWSPWTDTQGDADEGPDASSPEARSTRSVGPMWLGDNATTVEVRVKSGDVNDLKVTGIDTESAKPSGSALATPVADARVPPPFIAPRSAWGADESFRFLGNPGCTGTPSYAPNVRNAIVHHTVNSNNYSPGDVPTLIRGIYYFHTHDNGWCDIGYNFLIDRFGGIWEGRYGGIFSSVIGAHTSGFNTGSTGVSLIGNFDVAGVPGAAYSALRSLLAFKLSYHGVDPAGQSVVTVLENTGAYWPAGTVVVINNISGHRDENQTACPGRFLEALLPQLRIEVAALVGIWRDHPVICNWQGNGVDSPGTFLNGQWYIRFSETTGVADMTFPYGNPGDIPVCGDWDGNGTETPGVFRNGVWYLRNSLSAGVADVVVGYGNAGDQPVVGDWNGDHRTDLGVYRGDTWYLRSQPSSGQSVVADNVFRFGNTWDQPVSGDWNGVGSDQPGVVRNGTWYLRNSKSGGVADVAFLFGNPGDTALTGDWNRDGRDSPGVNRGAFWYVRNTNTSGTADGFFGF